MLKTFGKGCSSFSVGAGGQNIMRSVFVFRTVRIFRNDSSLAVRKTVIVSPEVRSGVKFGALLILEQFHLRSANSCWQVACVARAAYEKARIMSC